MKKIESWYWQYGVQRGNDQSDPDHEKWKVPIGGWLDHVEQILNRDATIRANASARACIALWGPSQTGKSTLLSRYIDGERADGIDSAMTWNDAMPVRFSPLFNQDVPAGTLVFNPYHQGSDASGVATRYTLGKDGEVDSAYPVEMKLATRAQVINALSLGYLTDCRSISDTPDYTVESFLERVAPDGVEHPTPDRQGYAMLCDIADVIQLMRSKPRFHHLFFRKGEWETKVRPQLVSSLGLVSDLKAATAFMEEIFWESAEGISEICRETLAVRDKLVSAWGSRRIFLSQEAAALILDIDTYRSFVKPESERSAEVAEKVRRIQWTIDGDRVLVAVGRGAGAAEISGASFGFFQALCGELVVPLRAAHLGGDAKAPFLRLIEKSDILDLPGLSNVNRGNNVGGENSASLDLSKADATQILTRVFKEGKTQSLVHGHALGYGLDAFVILSRADRAPSKSDLIGEGIGEWLTSFDADWHPGEPCGMPVFIDLTFFSSVVNDITANRGVGDGLAPIFGRLQENMAFCKPGACRWFATNYAHIPNSEIKTPAMKDFVIDAVAGDKTFLPQTGMKREDIDAVFAPDGGTGRMLGLIADAVSPRTRATKCLTILSADKKRLLELVRQQLPGKEAEDATRQRIAHFRAEVEQRICEAEKSDDFENLYMDLARVFKAIFSATPGMFEPVPMNFGGFSKKKAVDYVSRQAVRWFDAKAATCRGIGGFDVDDVMALLSALRDSINATAAAKILHGPGFGMLADGMTTQAARFPLSLLFTNLLLHGKTSIEGNDETEEDAMPERVLNHLLTSAVHGNPRRETSPMYCKVIKPALARIEEIERTFKSRGRPPQYGDNELAALLGELEAAQQTL